MRGFITAFVSPLRQHREVDRSRASRRIARIGAKLIAIPSLVAPNQCEFAKIGDENLMILLPIPGDLLARNEFRQIGGKWLGLDNTPGRHFLRQDTKSLAAILLEHFLLYFAVLKAQKVTVISSVEEPVDLSGLYQEMIGDRHKQESLDVGEHTFVLHHLFVKPTTTRKNLVRFCARRRVVESENVSSLIPEVSSNRAVTLQGSYRYHAYVTGAYLDEIVDDERSTLRWPKNRMKDDTDEPEEIQLSLIVSDADEDTGAEGVTKEKCCECVAVKIRDHLKDHISDVRKKRERQLEDFAHQEQPQFRPFVNSAKEKLDRLPARPSKRDIEMALYEAKIDGRADMEKVVDEIVKNVASADQVAQQSKHLMDKFATEVNRQAISALAEYVCTRKAVIDVLKANLAKRTDGKYEYEEVVHDLFFPRHCTSNKFPVGPLGPGEREIENLWLIDERLVFHRLLTSDKPLSTLKKLRLLTRICG